VIDHCTKYSDYIICLVQQGSLIFSDEDLPASKPVTDDVQDDQATTILPCCSSCHVRMNKVEHCVNQDSENNAKPNYEVSCIIRAG
jgi:hypothetical protein